MCRTGHITDLTGRSETATDDGGFVNAEWTGQPYFVTLWQTKYNVTKPSTSTKQLYFLPNKHCVRPALIWNKVEVILYVSTIITHLSYKVGSKYCSLCCQVSANRMIWSMAWILVVFKGSLQVKIYSNWVCAINPLYYSQLSFKLRQWSSQCEYIQLSLKPRKYQTNLNYSNGVLPIYIKSN
jgi:hypothetical protein